MKILKVLFDYEISGHGIMHSGEDEAVAFALHDQNKIFADAYSAAKAKILQTWEENGVNQHDIKVYNVRVQT